MSKDVLPTGSMQITYYLSLPKKSPPLPCKDRDGKLTLKTTDMEGKKHALKKTDMKKQKKTSFQFLKLISIQVFQCQCSIFPVQSSFFLAP